MGKVKSGKPESAQIVTDPARVRHEAIRAVRIIIARPRSSALSDDETPRPVYHPQSAFRISL